MAYWHENVVFEWVVFYNCFRVMLSVRVCLCLCCVWPGVWSGLMKALCCRLYWPERFHGPRLSSRVSWFAVYTVAAERHHPIFCLINKLRLPLDRPCRIQCGVRATMQSVMLRLYRWRLDFFQLWLVEVPVLGDSSLSLFGFFVHYMFTPKRHPITLCYHTIGICFLHH